MSDRNDNQRAAFDDDRLLDYALGIEDDPELAVALSSSARLRERLADLKSDLAAIETELHRTVPPIDESYADPGAAARWPRLQRSFGDGATVRRRPPPDGRLGRRRARPGDRDRRRGGAAARAVELEHHLGRRRQERRGRSGPGRRAGRPVG
jgi:hypothetical protein